MILNRTVEHVDLESLTPHPDNPRRGNIDAIADSIRINGFYGTIVANQDGTILAGNHRYLAAKQVGLETVPVVRIDVDEATARRILLADNRTADLAEYDAAQLAELLDAFDTLEGTGYTDDELQEMIGDLPDFNPVDEEPPRLDRKQLTECPECGHQFEPTSKTRINE